MEGVYPCSRGVLQKDTERKNLKCLLRTSTLGTNPEETELLAGAHIHTPLAHRQTTIYVHLRHSSPQGYTVLVR